MYIFSKQASKAKPRQESQTVSLEDPVIVCRNCNFHITRPSCQINMDGAFCHTFANPHGHVFEIGCFDSAPGCAPASPSSSEFSWFRGYDWKIGVCRDCETHLGWIFNSDQYRFFGLILEKLVFP
ncbi:MAG: cereblon family protein [Desulfobacula sp.]|nr:cereblon family protein [Desulfobacula sp.]